MRFSRRTGLVLLVVLLLAGLAAVTGPLWLSRAGHALIQDDQPRKADMIVVLAGDWKGERIRKACEVAQAGFAPLILVSGPMAVYARNEADLAIEFAIQSGCPASLMQPVYLTALSTEEEAAQLEPELRRRNARSVLVATSNYHSSRAGRIFRKQLGGEIEVHMIAAPDRYFDPDRWWQTREGQKTMFYECSKTVGGALGL